MNNNTVYPTNEQAKLLSSYRSARLDVLLIVAFTLINILLTISGADTYFLFSAYIPFDLVLTTMFVCGKLPSDWYVNVPAEFEFLDVSLFYISLAVAAICILLYVICLVFSSKNRYGWLIAALVFFSLDTLYLLSAFDASILIDLILHAVAIVGLARGVHAGHRLKSLPPAEDHTFATTYTTTASDSSQNTSSSDGF